MSIDSREFQGIDLFERTFRHQIKSDGEIGDIKWMFTKKFGNGEDEAPVEKDRYAIVWMPGCPHAHKVVITWKLLGLDRVISLSTAGIYRSEKGWVFSEDRNEIDPTLKIHYLHDIYTRNDSEYTGRSTVPIIVDKTTGQGVNNDHFWIPIYLETAWKKFHKKNAPDLYPQNLREEIDKLNLYVFERINKGVYGCGFARSQSAYEKAYYDFFEAMDLIDERLEKNRFLFGDFITDTDIRLFPSLVRFQATYYEMYRANRNRLEDFKNLWDYARDLYRIPAFRESTHIGLIKKHYQLSPHLKSLWGNRNSIVAKGPDETIWELPTTRSSLSSHSDVFLHD